MRSARRLALCVWLLGLMLAPPAVMADDADATIDEFVGRLTDLETALFNDAADGRLDDFDPLGAALVASGVEDRETLAAYRAAAAALAADLKKSEKLDGTPRQQAEAIFDFMHRRVLRDGYRLEATDLRATIDRGQFNCVSASVLFNYLASQCGLAVCGLETPGHAMSRVQIDDEALDIETTCPRWFRLSHDPQRQAEHVKKTLGTSAGERGPLREVAPIEIAAMIYYNRGVDLLADKRFAAAAAANAKALRLDPSSKTARGNLLATLNNWAIVEGTMQRYEQALDLLRRGLTIDSAYETFALNYVHVCHQWSLDLCLRGNYEAAARMLLQAIEERPGRTYLWQAAADVYRRWARSRFDAHDTAGAFERFDAARLKLGATPELLAAEAAEISEWGQTLLGRGKTEAAVDVFERGLARLPQSPVLVEGHRAAASQRAGGMKFDPFALP